jgi:spermidine synthase
MLLQLPVALLHGALFVLACALLARATADPTKATGRVYTLETAGTIAGGLLAGYLLVPHIPAMTAAALLAFLNGSALLNLSRLKPARRLVQLCAAGCLLLAAGLLAVTPLLEHTTLQRQWQGRELVGYHNSPYQNLAVVQSGPQLTFYGDGLPLFSVPDPDIAAVEEFTHLPLLAHPTPRRVLVLGGGAGGSVAESLRHPSVTRIDCVEFDPWLTRTVTAHAPADSQAFLADPRVTMHHGDLRLFLREVREPYDVILLGMPLPVTLQGNRLYTAEFFALARQALTSDGLLAVTASGSLTYYGPELLAVNASLLQTLKAVFAGVRVVPGDSNLFLASPAATVTRIDAGTLGARLQARQPATRLITPEHLDYLLDPERQQWFLATVAGAGAVNRDFAPRLLFDHLAYGTILFTPQLRETFDRLHQLTLAPLAFGLITIGLGAGILGRRHPAMVCPLVIAVTGFTAMLLELVLLCAFQILYCAMFQALALLISTFMIGLAGGSWLVTAGPLAGRDERRLLLATEWGLLLFAGALALLFTGTALPMEGAWRAHLLTLPLLAVTGLLTGMQFPLASRLQQICHHLDDDLAATGRVGAIYGADLLGGCLGGLLGGVVLLPVLGLAGSCLLAVAGKIASLAILLISRKTG